MNMPSELRAVMKLDDEAKLKALDKYLEEYEARDKSK